VITTILSIPKEIKAVQPVAHFVPAGNPYKEIINAAAANITSRKRLNMVINQSGKLISLFILRDEHLHCNAGAVSISISGITRSNILIGLHN